MSKRSDELEKRHNDGQRDAADGTYNEPYGVIETVFSTVLDVGKTNEERDEEVDAYKKGHENGSEQSRVLCTHFYRQGLLPREVWRADMAFTKAHISKVTIRGYHYWGIPYVKLMRISPLAERIMFPLAKNRAEELAYQMGILPRGNFKGKIVRLIGESFCWLLGCIVSQKDWRVLAEQNKRQAA